MNNNNNNQTQPPLHHQQDKAVQFKMFENDIMKTFDWIKNNRDLLIYTKLGTNLAEAKECLEQHNFYGTGSMNVYVNIKRLEQTANSLIAGNYELPEQSNTIRQLYQKLERCWQEYTLAIEQKGNLIKSAIKFYEHTENYLKNYVFWTEKCQLNFLVPNDVSELEELVHQHQTLNEQIQEEFSKTNKSSKAFLSELELFICKHQQKSPNFKKEYQEASSNVLKLTNDISVKQLQLDSIWQLKKVKLHQRLALELFQGIIFFIN